MLESYIALDNSAIQITNVHISLRKHMLLVFYRKCGIAQHMLTLRNKKKYQLLSCKQLPLIYGYKSSIVL